MASKQVEFLEKAIASNVDTAAAAVPGALRDDELSLVRQLSKEQLKNLLDLRKTAETAAGIEAVHGSGVLSM